MRWTTKFSRHSRLNDCPASSVITFKHNEVQMPPRRSLSTRARLDLFLQAKGRCASCTLPIAPGKGWDIDHIIPLALGGSDTPDNLQILCRICHSTKTAKHDVPAIAKTERIRARHLGAKVARRPMPFGRASPFKKTIYGIILKRNKNTFSF